METSTDSTHDGDSFVTRMFRCMSAGNVLPVGMAMERAHPAPKGFIIADLARRQDMTMPSHLEAGDDALGGGRRTIRTCNVSTTGNL